MNEFILILVTAPNIKLARSLVNAALKPKLAACANIIPSIESHYWWKEKLENEREVLILFKTIEENIPELEQTICNLHPYDTPEFIAIPIASGSQKYLNWISENIN
tara:strand:+ start:146 stop:463 length:318 start_codon:yes stop_codon:yes gene_type:complete